MFCKSDKLDPLQIVICTFSFGHCVVFFLDLWIMITPLVSYVTYVQTMLNQAHQPIRLQYSHHIKSYVDNLAIFGNAQH